ncbi:MAG TPA: biotin--[acetyl-CoA-carboxylase] ligase [Stellaceae bacterium]|jgi:BirA family biotin operon repressor/biotin-[acetyl-CoA-carboxylase] ligase|nr:biotin--[acetyl-CoA-carboxylase] ligase [Stellaceae bacterium]
MNDAPSPVPRFGPLLIYDRVGSTNDIAKELARAGKPDRTLVWAREQTAGRGRRGRVWHSPPGNFYLSFVLRPAVPATRAAQLGFVTALGLGDALIDLAGHRLDLRYKWPNDLLVGGKKIAGILLESETAVTGDVEFVVVGVGVNTAEAPENVEYPATSLAAEGVSGVTASAMLTAFARRFDRWDRRWQRFGFAPVRAAWMERAAGLGDDIRVRLGSATLTGRFADLGGDGALVLDAADGRRRIAAGDVFPAA